MYAFDPDQVVVLNLKRRPDRLMSFLAGLPRDWPWMPPLTTTGVDGQEVPIPPDWLADPGAYGCALSHISVLEGAQNVGIEVLLVLEDDAIFVSGFAAQVSQFAQVLPSNWDMVMLGGQHCSTPLAVKSGVVRCVHTQRTHAYLVRQRAIPTLLTFWRRSHSHIDHQAKRVQTALVVYAPDPLLVGQAAGWSDIVHRSEPSRFWNSSMA